MAKTIVPGALVRHPNEPGWGIGRVQSSVGGRVTVNFENAGKKIIQGGAIDLVVIEEASNPR